MLATKVRFALCLLLICATAAVVPASAQHFQQIEGVTLTQVAAGRNEVWGLNGSEVYRFNATTKKFAKVTAGLIKGLPLTQIAVGGGTLMQRDEVWGIAYADWGVGVVFHYDFSGNHFEAIDSGLGYFYLSQIAVGPGYEDACHPYEVWGVAVVTSNPSDNGTYRYNYCTSQFDAYPAPSGISFSQIATGGGDIWAVSPTSGGNTNVWEYNFWYGWLNGGVSTGLPSFVSQISVGVNNVWALDNYDFPTGWAAFFGNAGYDIYLPAFGQVAVGGDGVWFIASPSSGSNVMIYRYDFQTQQASFSFSLTSSAVQIAVGSGAGVWAVDSGGRVYTFVRP